ncbi:hypothetical protein CTAYLR_003008 [Chrysophaeum taylorii]|uniref:Fe2OG dioxygenase domain-containing protein n=1 Tax=Chrysophaeum taylorii TaxID=2483200 RepID=A0AAD7XJE0_9STRA|nr:hypothetical protein CTAYLR_003008 [Chrysophaeum taylorii]
MYGFANSSYADMWRYHNPNDTWEEVLTTGDVPSARLHHSMVAVNDAQLLIFDGFNVFKTMPDHDSYDDLYSLDISTRVWTKLGPNDVDGATRPSKRGAHDAVYVDGYVFVFGGFEVIGATGHYAELWRYDYRENFWTDLTPENNNNPGEDDAFAAGRGSRGLDSWSYTPLADAWTQLDPDGDVPAARRATHGDIAVYGILHLYGGVCIVNGTSEIFDDFYAYDPTSNTWFLGMPWSPSSFAVTVDKVLSQEECSALIARADEAGWAESPMAPLQSGLRSRLDDPELTREVFSRLRPSLPGVHLRRAVVGLTPTLRFVRYPVGCAVAPHPDTAGGDRHTPVMEPCSSLLTCLLYLNEGYVGCETHLLPPDAKTCEGGVRVEPAVGRALIFDHGILHGCPPLSSGPEKIVCRVDVAFEDLDHATGEKLANPYRDSTLRRRPTPAARRAFSKVARALARPTEARTFSGAVAVVTGSSSGIGKALCEGLRGLGMDVVGVARSNAEVCADVTDPTSAARVLASAFGRSRVNNGAPLVLVNNAGIGDERALVLDGDQEACERVFRCNALAPLDWMREFIRLLRTSKAPRGHVFNISSMSAHRLLAPHLGVYAASKAALQTLTEAARLDLQRRDLPYKVSLVSPGLVETNFYARMTGSQAKADLVYAASRSLHPQDVVDAVLYALQAPDRVQVHDILLRPQGGH